MNSAKVWLQGFNPREQGIKLIKIPSPQCVNKRRFVVHFHEQQLSLYDSPHVASSMISRWGCHSWIHLFLKSLPFALHTSPLSVMALQSSKVEVILWPMVGRPVCLGIKNSSGAYDQIFITVWQLHACWCAVLSLTRGRVCSLPDPQSAVVSPLSLRTIYILHVIKCMYISLTHGAEPFLRSCQLCSYSRTSKHFMEPEGSLPCSQEPSTGPHPEPDRYSPYHRNLRSWSS
jgi:hypothetical protein